MWRRCRSSSIVGEHGESCKALLSFLKEAFNEGGEPASDCEGRVASGRVFPAAAFSAHDMLMCSAHHTRNPHGQHHPAMFLCVSATKDCRALGELAAAEAAVRRWRCADVDGGRAREILGRGEKFLCTTRRGASTNRIFEPLAADSASVRARSQLRHQGGSESPRSHPRAQAICAGVPTSRARGEPPHLAHTRCPSLAPRAGRTVEADGKPQPHREGESRLLWRR